MLAYYTIIIMFFGFYPLPFRQTGINMDEQLSIIENIESLSLTVLLFSAIPYFKLIIESIPSSSPSTPK